MHNIKKKNQKNIRTGQIKVEQLTKSFKQFNQKHSRNEYEIHVQNNNNAKVPIVFQILLNASQTLMTFFVMAVKIHCIVLFTYISPEARTKTKINQNI